MRTATLACALIFVSGCAARHESGPAIDADRNYADAEPNRAADDRTSSADGTAFLASHAHPERATPNSDPESIQFMRDATTASAVELELGQLARRRAHCPCIRALTESIVGDHQNISAELQQIADGQHIAIDEALPARQRAIVERINNTEGDEFDRAYLRAVLRQDEESVRMYARQARAGSDSEIRAFAQRTLPLLREHVTIARRAARTIGLALDTARAE